MELLRSWVNDDLQLSRHVNSFEKDMANGYLIGEILARHGLLRSMDALQDKETPGAKVNNLTAVQQALLDIGVKYDSNIANSIMTEKKGAATNLCYQLRLGLQNAKGAGKPVIRRNVPEPVLMSSTIKARRRLAPPPVPPSRPSPTANAARMGRRASPTGGRCASSSRCGTSTSTRWCAMRRRTRRSWRRRSTSQSSQST